MRDFDISNWIVGMFLRLSNEDKRHVCNILMLVLYTLSEFFEEAAADDVKA